MSMARSTWRLVVGEIGSPPQTICEIMKPVRPSRR
jgi:hypothetical protein